MKFPGMVYSKSGLLPPRPSGWLMLLVAGAGFLALWFASKKQEEQQKEQQRKLIQEELQKQQQR